MISLYQRNALLNYVFPLSLQVMAVGAARFNPEKATGFYHRSYQLIRKYLLTESKMAIACVLGMIAGAVLAMVTAASLDPTYAATASAGESCVYDL